MVDVKHRNKRVRRGLGPHLGLSGRHELWLLSPDGLFYPARKCDADRYPASHRGPLPPVLPVHNIITNGGLDLPATNNWGTIYNAFSCGTDGTPAVAEDTGLLSYLAHSTTVVSGTSFNSFLANATDKYVELTRTVSVYTNSSGSSVNIAELGVGPSNTANAQNLWSRVALDPVVTVPNGFRLVDRYTIRIYVPDWRVVSDYTLVIGSQSVPGVIMFGEPGSGAAPVNMTAPLGVNTGGLNASNVAPLAPYNTGANKLGVINNTSLYAGLASNASISMTGLTYVDAFVSQSYAAGARSRVWRVTMGESTLSDVSTLNGFVFGANSSNAAPASSLGHFIFRANSAFFKPLYATWNVDFTLSWDRATV